MGAPGPAATGQCHNLAVGMFDWYEPEGDFTCPECAGPVGGWQGKDGPCALLLWRQGFAHPVEQRVDDAAAVDAATLLGFELPSEFEISTWCANGHLVSVLALCNEGVWTACGPPASKTLR